MWKPALAIIGGILIVGLIIYFLFSMSFPLFETPENNQEETNEDIIDVASIAEDPIIYEDLTVTVEGELVDWVTKRSFTISGSQGFIGGGQVLVIRREEFKLPRDTPANQVALGEEGIPVRVTGPVRDFGIEQAEEELDVDLLDEEVGTWEGRPVIIADSVQQTE